MLAARCTIGPSHGSVGSRRKAELRALLVSSEQREALQIGQIHTKGAGCSTTGEYFTVYEGAKPRPPLAWWGRIRTPAFDVVARWDSANLQRPVLGPRSL